MVFLISQISLLEKRMIQFGKVTVEKGVTTGIDALLEEDASFFIQKAKSSQIVQNLSFKDKIEAPIEKGTVIGEVTYSLDDKVVKKVNVVASSTVKKINLINMTTNVYNNWFNLLR